MLVEGIGSRDDERGCPAHYLPRGYGKTKMDFKRKKKVERKPEKAKLPKKAQDRTKSAREQGTISKEGDEEGWRGKESDEELKSQICLWREGKCPIKLDNTVLPYSCLRVHPYGIVTVFPVCFICRNLPCLSLSRHNTISYIHVHILQ